MKTEQIVEVVGKIDRFSNWSIQKGDSGIHVMADHETCFICHDLNSALQMLLKAAEARNSGASNAIRSLSESFRNKQCETAHE